MACICAAGYSLPPMVIFYHKGLNPDWTDGEVPGTRYGLNESGWIDHDLFDGWFNEVFLKFIPSTLPILLLLDGHSSHYNPAVVKKAASSGVIIFCLPPNTTRLLQPLDRVWFSAVKQAWSEACQNYVQQHPGKVVTRTNFCQIFRLAWVRAMTIKNIVASFKTTGIYPFNRGAIPSITR